MRFVIILILLVIGSSPSLLSQEKFLTKKGHVTFYSQAPLEDIEAENNQVLSIVDIATGEIAITILMKSFAFEKALMQQHFNESYVESDKFPKASFSGTILNLGEIQSDEEGVAKIKGNLSIHGVTKPVTIESTAVIKKDKVRLKGTFMITVAEYNIKVPAVVRNNIAREVEVSFQLEHQPYN